MPTAVRMDLFLLKLPIMRIVISKISQVIVRGKNTRDFDVYFFGALIFFFCIYFFAPH